MTDFFVQSGYPATFLRFIMTAEVLGGAALLVPWAVIPAAFGLSIDMFGAIYTHIHNGDPINDSMGAIATLVRLGVILAIWAIRTPPGAPSSRARRRLILAGAGLAVCALLAVTGSAIVRHPPPPARNAVTGH